MAGQRVCCESHEQQGGSKMAAEKLKAARRPQNRMPQNGMQISTKQLQSTTFQNESKLKAKIMMWGFFGRVIFSKFLSSAL